MIIVLLYILHLVATISAPSSINCTAIVEKCIEVCTCDVDFCWCCIPCLECMKDNFINCCQYVNLCLANDRSS